MTFFLAQIFVKPRGLPDGGQSGFIALKFEHVTVSFIENQALDDISFEVPAGDTRILFGAAEGGKTVVLKATLGLLKPASGRILCSSSARILRT